MNDDFLYSLRAEPDPAFKRNLKHKLDREEQLATAPERTRRVFTFGWAFAAVAVVLMLIVVAIPSVRAAVGDVLTTIGNQAFVLTNEYPETDDVIEVAPEILPLDAALASFDAPVALPTVPDGYILRADAVELYTGDAAGNLADTLVIAWDRPEKGVIRLIVMNHELPTTFAVSPDAIEEIALRGQYPAAIIDGGWSENTKAWSKDLPLRSVIWEHEGLSYELSGTNVDDLIFMAESLLP